MFDHDCIVKMTIAVKRWGKHKMMVFFMTNFLLLQLTYLHNKASSNPFYLHSNNQL